HEQRRIGKRDLTTAQVDQGHHVVDLKLMNRIDLHDLVTVALKAPIASFLVLVLAAIQAAACHDARRTHHIEHAGSKAEQQKYNEPPRRYTEQAIDAPAEAGTDQHAGNEFAREPKAPGVARCSRRAIFRSVVGRVVGTLACKTFAEPL